MFIATVVLSALLALGFVAAGLPKLLKRPSAVTNARHLGYSTAAFRLIGLVELAGAAGLAVGLWLWPLGVAAAAGLLVVCAGALRAHLRAKDSVQVFAPALVFAVIAAATLIVRIASS